MAWTLLFAYILATASANETFMADWATRPDWWSQRQGASVVQKSEFAAKYVSCDKGFQPSYRETGVSREATGEVRLQFYCFDPAYELPRNWLPPKLDHRNRAAKRINPQLGVPHAPVEVAEEPALPGTVDRVAAADLEEILAQEKRPVAAFTSDESVSREPVPERQASESEPAETETTAAEPSLSGKIPIPKPRRPTSLERLAAKMKIPDVIFDRAYDYYKELVAKGETESPCFQAVDLTAPGKSQVWLLCTSPIPSVELSREEFGRGTGPECKRNPYVNPGTCAQFFGDREGACLSAGGRSMRLQKQGAVIPRYSYPAAEDIRRARRHRRVYWNEYCRARVSLPSWIPARPVRAAIKPVTNDSAMSRPAGAKSSR